MVIGDNRFIQDLGKTVTLYFLHCISLDDLQDNQQSDFRGFQISLMDMLFN